MKTKSYCLAGALMLMLSASALSSETIDFESLDPGTIVDTVFSAGGVGPIGVLGSNPDLDARFTGPNNAAVIFDSATPPNAGPNSDFDLGTPNEVFSGPGVGPAGESGPFVNDTAQNHILIINEAYRFVDRDLNNLINNTDSPVTLTDDADNADEPIVFGFSTVGPVSVESITLIDVEATESPATVELQDGSGTTLATFTLPQTGDNGVAQSVSLGPTAGVTTMIVTLNGSGAIDDIVFTPPSPPTAALGDRVWEDLDADGIQDCEDTNQNNIIGDAGDTGSECDAGIPEVPVNLLAGDCQTSLGQTVMTDLNGFYLFENLDPGDYCVEFEKPPVDFCYTDGFGLGEPQFTSQNAGADDAVDSDANTATGVTDPTSLAAGETDLTVDAGIVCPAKIGDRVWSDDNENGVQDDGPGGVEGVKVTLFECGDDMVAGTADDVDTGQMRNTDTDGMYMFGAEPDFTLDPGKYYVQFMKPDGTQYTAPVAGADPAVDSDCLPPNGISSCVTLGSRDINLDRDCGLIPPPPPECDLELDKTCRVEVPPVTGDLECEAKIAATVLEYIGSDTPVAVTVEGKNKKATVAANFDSGTGLLTIDARPEDLGAKMTITTDGVAEVIHTSCSTPYVAGLPAPLDNPKGDPSANWLVLSFVDKEGGSASVPDDGNGDGDGVFTDNCTLTEPSQNVTYRYVVTNNGDTLSGVLVTDNLLGDVGGPIDMIKGQTETFFKSTRITGTTVNIGTAVGKLSDGSDCPASDTTTVTVLEPPVVGGECDGKVTNLTLKNLGDAGQVRVEQKKDGDTVFNQFVPAGGEFSFSGTDKKGTLSTEISIFVGGDLNTKIHTSCSQPIGPGLVSGDFEVISGDSRNGGPLPPI